MSDRLQKVLAHAGVASRRAAERLIREGRVSVNGEIVSKLGTKVDPTRDAIKLDGRRVGAPPPAPVYLMLNKPREVVTTLSDPEGRTTVLDLVRGLCRRIYPVGRLDYHSEGLLLLTDDGELARDLMHPSRGVVKVYQVKVRGNPPAQTLQRLSRGVTIDGRLTRPVAVRTLRSGTNMWLEIQVNEGRKHLIRKMLQAVGHPVSRLRRTRYGPLVLGRLPSGQHRPLTASEVTRLRSAVNPSQNPRRASPARDRSA